MSFACRQHLGSRLLTSRHASFQRCVVKLDAFSREDALMQHARIARDRRSRDVEKQKQKLHRRVVSARLYTYIPWWSHPFRHENGQWHRRTLSGGFRWSPIVRGQSDAIVKTGAKSSHCIDSPTCLLNIDDREIRADFLFSSSYFLFSLKLSSLHTNWFEILFLHSWSMF